ncbi:MAG: hypothetical protein V4611_04945 [Patescibacteria group bacterium]
MKKIRIIGAIVLMVAIAFLGVILFMRMQVEQVRDQQQTQAN